MKANKPQHVYIAILRGINVGGHRKLPMKDLRLMLENMGLSDVATYIQSGNIVFRSEVADRCELENKIAGTIEKQWGFDVPVIVLTAEALSETANLNPFLKDENPEHLHITFLKDEPKCNLPDGNSANDRAIRIGLSVYLFCPDGYGSTKFTNNYFESKLKTTATTRNLKTVNKLLEMAMGLESV